MQYCSPSIAPIVKGDRFELSQFPPNYFEWKHMKDVPYASIVGSLMYAQGRTKRDIAYDVRVLGGYQSNSGVDHLKAANKVMRYHQGTNNFMLVHKQTYNLKVIEYSNLDYVGCIDAKKINIGLCFSATWWSYILEKCKAKLESYFDYGS